MKFKVYPYLLTLLFVLSTHYEQCQATLYSHYQMSYKSPEGIGNDDGYATLSALLSPEYPCELHPFVDLRGHILTNGLLAANAGVGLRTALQEAIFGMNTYYDYRQFRQDKGCHYHRIGFGIEWLGPTIDLRLNGYSVISPKITCKDQQFSSFKRNTAFGKERTTSALSMIDAEIGTAVAPHLNYVNGYFAAGPYYLFKRRATHCHLGGEWGAQARCSVTLYNTFTAGAEISYDPIFKTRGRGYIQLSFAFGGKSYASPRHYPFNCQKLIQPVRRNEIIPIEKKSCTFDILEGQPNQKILFVDNTNTSAGNGTFEDPFNTLISAESASNEGDIIYVFAGNGTSKGMDSGFIMKERQRLIGSATWFELCGIHIPEATPDCFPLIQNTERTIPVDLPFTPTNTAAFGVIMKEGTEVTGLHFDGQDHPEDAASFGAVLADGNTFTIYGNIFSQQLGAGIYREGPLEEGSVLIGGNTFSELRSLDYEFNFGVLFKEKIDSSSLCIAFNAFADFQLLGRISGVIFLEDVTDSQHLFKHNLFKETEFGISFFESTLSNSSITLDDNFFTQLDSALLCQNSALDHCTINTQGNIFTHLTNGTNWMNCQLNYCDLLNEKNSFSNMDIGALWFSTQFNECTINACDNTFQSMQTALLRLASDMDNCCVTACHNHFKNLASGIFSDIIGGATRFCTFCLTENTFSEISDADFSLSLAEGSTFCIENNQFATLFELNADNPAIPSCLRLVGNSMADDGAYLTTAVDTLEVEELSNIAALNNNQGNFAGIEGTEVPANTCQCPPPEQSAAQ